MIRSAILVAVLACVASRADAYSDPQSFAAPVWQGGADGRWFTGSASDGHTCAVCHAGGTAAPVRIDGLPLDGYLPGAHYEVVVDWPDEAMHVGATVELSDAEGRAAGTLALPNAGEIDDAELCVPLGARIGAASLPPIQDQRSVVTVADCGAQQLRFQWTAPSEVVGDVRFSGALVVGDASANPANDGVTAFSRVLRPAGVAPTANVSRACAVNADRSPLPSLVWIVLMIGWLLRRRSTAT